MIIVISLLSQLIRSITKIKQEKPTKKAQLFLLFQLIFQRFFFTSGFCNAARKEGKSLPFAPPLTMSDRLAKRVPKLLSAVRRLGCESRFEHRIKNQE
ncbi:hypothetical protein [uncultured Cohaesibacter sp.]|uniref:hypothetical protein n=1 Tax=uncultured Cohaesibacter sp. TaxID=1002546 RepID=UPI0037490DEB